MAAKRIAPHGSWSSPITADLIASTTIGLSSIVLDGGDVYWIEMRPAEGGRCVIVRRTSQGETSDVLAPPFSARSRVHEYGGGAFTVADGAVYFVNYSDQRLYLLNPDGEARPLTPQDDFRYADLAVDRQRGSVICVREDHTVGGREAANTLVSVPLREGHAGTILAEGHDFYSSPRLSPDGALLAWLAWDHPNMPWDGTELWVGELDNAGSISRAECAAGGREESIFQPEWSPDGTLHFVSDRSGWWNLYRWRAGQAEALCPMEADFGVPQWTFGASTYAFEAPHRIVCAFCREGGWRLARLDTANGQIELLDVPYTTIGGLRVATGRLFGIGGSPTEPASIVELDLQAGGVRVLRRSTEVTPDEGHLSRPRAIEFQTEGAASAHGFFYAPRNRDYEAPADERPPLIVMSHGGPTGSTSTVLRLGIQFWTSRGFAVLDVDYRGSTGYGRAYRRLLDGQWGVADVDDCVNGAGHLVREGLVDPARLAITGGSAGGYTTLCALTFREVFHMGASHFGVSDLESLAIETHKFESRYLDRLIGPYPERRDLYRSRSPINFPERLARPVIFFQGLEDKIVPPNQAELMVAALQEKGVPVAYLAFAGEQHGFRRAENIQRSFEAELYFYSRIFGFKPADEIEPVEIQNL